MSATRHETAWSGSRPARGIDLRVARARLLPHAPLLGLLALTALLYLWGLSRLGYANDFYAAAVKSGTESWKAFFFGSLDAANYITVDKPPASLWAMELSGRILGFSSFSLLLPQALEGVAAVALTYAAVRRWFGAPAAFLAGLVLALTPVAAVMFRFNNPDALLVLLLVVSAYAVTRALERASTAWLALAGAAIGLGFLTKMMQAFLVLPAFALVYLVAAPTTLRRRLRQLCVSGLALLVAGGWWVAIVELWPASSRPYIGGSTTNSVLDLVWGYNGLGRIERRQRPGRRRRRLQRHRRAAAALQLGAGRPGQLAAAGSRRGAGGGAARQRAAVRARTGPVPPCCSGAAGWSSPALVYSLMSGIIHPYYTNTLGAPDRRARRCRRGRALAPPRGARRPARAGAARHRDGRVGVQPARAHAGVAAGAAGRRARGAASPPPRRC